MYMYMCTVVNAQKKEQHAPLFKACASTKRTVPKTLGISHDISDDQRDRKRKGAMSTKRVAFVVLGLTTVQGFTAAESLRSLSVRWSTPPAMVARETTRREALAASVGFVAWRAAAPNAGAEEESVAPPPAAAAAAAAKGDQDKIGSGIRDHKVCRRLGPEPEGW